MLEITQEDIEARLAKVQRYATTRAAEDRPLDGFEEPELRIALSLTKAFETEADKSLATLRATLGSSTVSPVRALDDVQNAFSGMNDIYREAEERAVTIGVTAAIGNAAEEAGLLGFIGSNASRVRSIYEGMIAAAKYTTNTYFNRIVYPSLEQAIQTMIETPGSDSLVSFDDIRTAMAARLKSVPYWRTVANGAASRAYHWGLVNAGLDAGYSSYGLNVTLDQRTSSVCRKLVGATFSIHDAIPFAQRVATATAEELPTVAPWLRDIDSVDDLRQRGYFLPPFHANCRTYAYLIR